MKNNLVCGISSLFVVLGALLSSSALAQESGYIKIGAILSLSGEASAEGKLLQEGIELALAEHSASRIRIAYEDDQTMDARATLSALQRILNDDKTVAVLDWTVQGAKVIGPTVNARKIPSFILWDKNRELEELKPYVHALGISTEASGAQMAEFAFDRLNVKRIAIVAAEDAWAAIISGAFTEKYENLGASVEISETCNVDESDFRALITRLREHRIPAVYAPLFGASRIAFIKQARQLKYQGKILTADMLQSDIETASGDADGIYSTQLWSSDSSLMKKYEAHYGKQSTEADCGMVAIGYRGMSHLISLFDSLKAASKPVTSKVLQELQESRGEDVNPEHTEVTLLKNRKLDVLK